jgi:Tat protein translocase TatB subunit
MFGIGLPELVLIMVVALLVVGPSKLPELARSLGKSFNEFRRMADDVKETLEEEVPDAETPHEKEIMENDNMLQEADMTHKDLQEAALPMKKKGRPFNSGRKCS